jgi:hypothetical protein
MVKNFNIESEKPQFIYKRNPLVKHAFQIFMFKDEKGDYEPVGDYTLLDMSEAIDLTEKTVMNLITALNGRTKLIDLGNLTSDRLLFNIVDNKDAKEGEVTIMLRTRSNQGVSKENAVLKIEKDVFHANQSRRS